MNTHDRTRNPKSPTNSFIDFLGQNQNQSKAQKKSLSYDNFKLRKIRALYGKRVTMQINENEIIENRHLYKFDKSHDHKSESEFISLDQ